MLHISDIQNGNIKKQIFLKNYTFQKDDTYKNNIINPIKHSNDKPMDTIKNINSMNNIKKYV